MTLVRELLEVARAGVRITSAPVLAGIGTLLAATLLPVACGRDTGLALTGSVLPGAAPVATARPRHRAGVRLPRSALGQVAAPKPHPASRSATAIGADLVHRRDPSGSSADVHGSAEGRTGKGAN